jgi:hypothetical protein
MPDWAAGGNQHDWSTTSNLGISYRTPALGSEGVFRTTKAFRVPRQLRRKPNPGRRTNHILAVELPATISSAKIRVKNGCSQATLLTITWPIVHVDNHNLAIREF